MCLAMIYVTGTSANQPIDYQHLEHHGHIIHVAKFNPKAVKIKLVQASNHPQNKATLTQLAKEHQALLAINAGFYTLDDQGSASPIGVLKINHQWVSGEKRARAVLGWGAVGTHIDNLVVKPNIKGFEPIPKRTDKERWLKLSNIIGGAGLLVYDGKLNRDFSQEKISRNDFIFEPHARTAVGVTQSGDWVIVVVEQRYHIDADKIDMSLLNAYILQQDEKAKQKIRQGLGIAVKGMTLAELSEFMLEQGCYWAMNLDGGGSTGLYYQQDLKTKIFDNKIVSDLVAQRPIHTAIIIQGGQKS